MEERGEIAAVINEVLPQFVPAEKVGVMPQTIAPDSHLRREPLQQPLPTKKPAEEGYLVDGFALGPRPATDKSLKDTHACCCLEQRHVVCVLSRAWGGITVVSCDWTTSLAPAPD